MKPHFIRLWVATQIPTENEKADLLVNDKTKGPSRVGEHEPEQEAPVNPVLPAVSLHPCLRSEQNGQTQGPGLRTSYWFAQNSRVK